MILISATADLNINGNPQIFVDGNFFTLAEGATNVSIVFDISAEIAAVVMSWDDITMHPITQLNSSGLTGTVDTGLGTFTISGTVTGLRTLTANITLRAINDAMVTETITLPIRIETIIPNFVALQLNCSYCLEFDPQIDSSPIANLAIASRGIMSYHQVTSGGTETLASAGWNTNVSHCWCGPTELDLNIYPILTIREIPNCGGTSPIVFQAIGDVQELEITEYHASIELPSFSNCCITLDEGFTITPTALFLGETGVTPCAAGTALIVLTNPDGTTTNLYNAAISNVTAPETLEVTFTPTELGAYIVTYTITGCCDTYTEVLTFQVCNGWTVEKGECNTIVITNNSTATITYTIRELNENGFELVEIGVLQLNIELGVGQSITIDLVSDNLYTVTIDGQEYVILLDCNIKLCEKELLLDFLCGTEGSCDVVELSNRQAKYVRFHALKSQLYGKWNEYYQTQSIYTVLNLNDENSDLLHLKDIVVKIQKICESCGVSLNCNTCKRTIKLTTDCGCN